MRLQIGPNIGNNKVRLDFKQSPGKPDNTPSYVIDAASADEFVNKYNDQSKNLLNLTVFLSAAGAIISSAAALKKKVSKFKTLISASAGCLTGFGFGVGVSSYKKHKIMEDYNIKEI